MDLVLKAITNGEELKTKDGYDKHINLEGARDHVLSYTNQGVHCSQKNCVVNRDNRSNTEDWIFIN